MNNEYFIAMSYKKRIDYFRNVGIRATYNIAMDDNHPLCIEANDYLDEKNE